MSGRKAVWFVAFLCVAILAFSLVAVAQEQTAPPARPEKISMIQVVKWGGIIGYIIIFLSIVTVALFFRSLFLMRRSVLMPQEVQEQLDALLREKKIKEAMEFCRNDDSVLSRIVGAGLSEIKSGYEDMRAIMTEVGEEESVKLHQQVGSFSLLGTISPMLGLLGTVSGMVIVFNKIASSKGLAKPDEMADGIQQALITTVFGLIVAIPNIVIFTLLRNRVVRLMLEIGVVAEELMSRFKGMTVAPAASGVTLPSAAKAATAARPASPAQPAPPPGQQPPPAQPAK